MDPPIPVDWQPLDLVVSTDDGVVVRPLEKRLRELWPSPRTDGLPFLVWLSDPVADPLETKLLRRPFQHRLATLILRKFRCLKLAVGDLPDSDVKRELSGALGLRFYDPAGRPVGKPIVGKRRGSHSRFLQREQRAWAASFETAFKAWAKPMLVIYRNYDEISAKEKAVDVKLRRLEMKPNPEVKKKVEAEAAELREEWKRFRADEASVMASVRLLPEFRPKPLVSK